MFDSQNPSMYGTTMVKKTIACLLFVVWVGLLEVEFCEELGWFAFADEHTAQAADDAAENLGRAIPAVYHSFWAFAKHLPLKLASVRSFAGSPAFELLALSSRHQLSRTIPKYLPIYKLYLTFESDPTAFFSIPDFRNSLALVDRWVSR